MTTSRGASDAQAWIELKADDPEAASAFEVARSRTAAGRALTELKRMRLIEIRGSARPAAALAEMLRGSTQFYNPHKERCALRCRAADPTPVSPDARLVLVWERGGERRAAAERWWRHETGERVEVREGVVWMLRFEPGSDADADASDLARLRDARHGLLCNPWAQELRESMPPAPLRWIEPERDTRAEEGDA